MWYGKIAIIMYLFSFATLFMMYYVNTIFHNPNLDANWNLAAVKALSVNLSNLQNNNGGQNPNPALIFGDFLTGVRVLFSVLTGGGVTTILQGVPFYDNNMIMITQIIYGSSAVLLWIYVISNRSL